MDYTFHDSPSIFRHPSDAQFLIQLLSLTVCQLVVLVALMRHSQGYLPGTITEKSSVYFEALYQALITANEMPEQAIRNTSMASGSSGSSCASDQSPFARFG